MDTSWISLTAVHDILRRTTSDRSEGNAKASKFAHQVEVAKTISEKLWSVPDELEALGGNLDKGGSIAGHQSEPPTAKGDSNCAQDPSTSTQDAQLHYQSFLQKKRPCMASKTADGHQQENTERGAAAVHPGRCGQMYSRSARRTKQC